MQRDEDSHDGFCLLYRYSHDQDLAVAAWGAGTTRRRGTLHCVSAGGGGDEGVQVLLRRVGMRLHRMSQHATLDERCTRGTAHHTNRGAASHLAWGVDPCRWTTRLGPTGLTHPDRGQGAHCTPARLTTTAMHTAAIRTLPHLQGGYPPAAAAGRRSTDRLQGAGSPDLSTQHNEVR